MKPAIMRRIEEIEAPKDERGYDIDPHNPWPRGCDWWLMHNERYTKSRWWRQRTRIIQP